jgi:hypothetical protein
MSNLPFVDPNRKNICYMLHAKEMGQKKIVQVVTYIGVGFLEVASLEVQS